MDDTGRIIIKVAKPEDTQTHGRECRRCSQHFVELVQRDFGYGMYSTAYTTILHPDHVGCTKCRTTSKTLNCASDFKKDLKIL